MISEDYEIVSLNDCMDTDHTTLIGKAGIEEAVRKFIELNLEQTDSRTLYIYLKQMEYAIKTSIDQVKDRAFDSFGEYLGGATSGKVMGHNVVITYPNEWHYSSAVDDLKGKQKKELAALQEKEKAEKIARQIPGKGRITVTLREG
ncbi:MAG: hypothetical protein ABIR47_04530 [Candidatus Kapaibacterium sp.]